jgi:hypothetical protein
VGHRQVHSSGVHRDLHVLNNVTSGGTGVGPTKPDDRSSTLLRGSKIQFPGRRIGKVALAQRAKKVPKTLMVRLHLRKPQNTMVNVAQVVEPGIVIPVVVGSSPIIHPNKQWMRSSIGRASACHVEGSGIETRRIRQEQSHQNDFESLLILNRRSWLSWGHING